MAKTTFELVTVKKALAWAHDEGNKHVLSRKEFEELGLSDQAYDQWEAFTDDLRVAAAEYNRLAQSATSTKEDLAKAEDAVWKAWRSVLAEGTEQKFNKNFFMRPYDAHTIGNWAALKAVPTAHGRVWGTQAKADFRRNIETMIGIRMAGNAMLTDDQHNLITSYEKAVASIQRNQEALEDSVQNGKRKPGLKSALESAKNRLNSMESLVGSLGDSITKDAADKILESAKSAVIEADTAVKTAEKAIKEAETKRDNLKDEYDKAIAKIKMLGDNK